MGLDGSREEPEAWRQDTGLRREGNWFMKEWFWHVLGLGSWDWRFAEK